MSRRFDTGRTVRELRERIRGQRLTIEEAAGRAGMSSTSRWWRLESRATNLDRWLEDLDDAAHVLGISLGDLVEACRSRRST